MKTYETADEMWMDALSETLEGIRLDSRDGGTTEVLGYAARLSDPRAAFIFNPVRKLAPWYASAELLWYLSGSDRIDMIKQYAPQYERFSDDGETAHGAYGKRMRGTVQFASELLMQSSDGEFSMPVEDFFTKQKFQSPVDQLSVAAMIMKQNPNSRQIVVSMWRDQDLAVGLKKASKDIPCTLTLQFLVRDGALNLIVNMRSNDLWLGLPYDVFCFCGIQRLLADALNLKLGFYQHMAGSLHIYDRNREKAIEAAAPRAFNTGPIETNPSGGSVRKEIKEAMMFEEHNRKIRSCAKPGFDHYSFMGQLVVLASLKWSEAGLDRVTSKLMKDHVKGLQCS